MDSGLYSAYTALRTRTEALDLAANNLANTSTAGFHAGRASFQGVLAEASDAMGSQVGTAVNSQTLLMGHHVSEVQGVIAPTGNPLDVAIKGTGYFTVKTAQGTRYTRDGQFQIDGKGVLTTKQGDAVLNAQGSVITVPSGDVRIAADGAVSVATQDGSAVVGQIGVMDLGSGGAVEAESAGMYRAADGVTPKVAVDTTLQQGAVEGANQNAVQGTVQLLTIQRQAEMMQRSLSVFYNDFDKTASEELARV
ncbi:MAG: flagellar hook basal-body protein [Acidobacteriaceae bacterium]|nr:flagellar hook basal-body protein [Acidobacteriaceae bacterium]